MSDLKRNASSSLAAMEASIETSVSKKMKSDFGSCQPQLPSSGVQLRSSQLADTAISPATSVNSTATKVSGEHFSGRLPLSCSSVSSANVETIDAMGNSTATALDPETSVLEMAGSAPSNVKLFSKDRYSLNEFYGDSEEMTVFPVKSSTEASEHRKFAATKMAPEEEIEEFFAMAEKYEQKRFAEKYNYDIVKDMPLQGKYEWVRLI
ncbi:cyclin-dependent kinase inhibitor 7-like [Neltuma alba]|uniref:cyclin-dependent kinase inhibitor 7-like n=1 Tax=Neltuma alba TaxID=207710 RepID=UPI0010A39F24|nr:cyclin-dependent kinase inhibitor 7-like [Prosopis alba]